MNTGSRYSLGRPGSFPEMDRVDSAPGSRHLLAWLAALTVAALFISGTDTGFVADCAKIIFLLFMMVTAAMDSGLAVGMLLMSLSLYNPKHVWAPGPILDRVDTCALIVVVAAFALKGSRSTSPVPWRLFASIALFSVYVLALSALQGLLTRANLAEFVRMFALPFFLFLLLHKSSFSAAEIGSFCRTVSVLGAYMALVSILEKLRLHPLIIPHWLADPSVNGSIGSGRSGGSLMQPEFNGFALSLIYCVIVAGLRLDRSAPLFKYLLCGACLIGVYLSYTRGAYLAVLLATTFFLVRNGFASAMATCRSILLVMSLILALGVGSMIPDQAVRDRTGDAGTIYYRLNLWYPAVKMALAKPLLGHGMGQFEKHLPDYHESLDLGPRMVMPEQGTGTHNIFLNLLTEHGLLGLLQYLFILFFMVSMSHASAVRIWGKRGGSWILVYTLVYLVNTQFLNAHEPVTNALYFGALGIISGTEAS